jgi:hypothetical protein
MMGIVEKLTTEFSDAAFVIPMAAKCIGPSRQRTPLRMTEFWLSLGDKNATHDD